MTKGLQNLGEKPMLPLLFSMALPPIFSMLIQSMYNIVDSIFVAQLSQNALTAVSLVYPIQNVILAIGLGSGIAVNSCISRNLGAGDRQKANQFAASGLVLAAVHFVLIAVLGLLLIRPFLGSFTSVDEIFSGSCAYATIVVLFSFGSIFELMLENIFVATGKMLWPMLLQALGAMINICLDPILIFGLLGAPALGVQGAAIATVIGQITACLIALILFLVKEKDIRLNRSHFHLKRPNLSEIYRIAIPSMIMLSLASAMVSILNRLLICFSETSVALFGVYYKLQTFVYLPTYGIMQALRPIVGFNYGAKNYPRVKQAIRLSTIFAMVIMAIGTALLLIIPQEILGLFSASEEMYDIGIPALRIISLGFIVSSIAVILTAVFEALGKGGLSLLVTLSRQIFLLLPLALLLSHFWGLTGIWVAFPVTEVLTTIFAVLLYKTIPMRAQA